LTAKEANVSGELPDDSRAVTKIDIGVAAKMAEESPALLKKLAGKMQNQAASKTTLDSILGAFQAEKPDVWNKATCPKTQKPYWWHPDTQQVQWEDPSASPAK
jgi:hypothetical protein